MFMAASRALTLVFIYTLLGAVIGVIKLFSLVFKKPMQFVDKIKSTLFYHLPLRYFMLICLDLFISAFISIKALLA